MILSHQKILELVKEKNLIENFAEECIEGAGYDLRVGRIYEIKSDSYIAINDRRTPEIMEREVRRYKLRPNQYILIETIERVNIPDSILARILPRSTLFRCGCSLITAVVDPGYKGTLTFALKNLSEFNFEFEIGSRIAQIVFETVDGETKGYNGRYQGGKIV